MTYTRHGHHIPNTPLPETQSDLPETVARCGGPGLCPACQEDMIRLGMNDLARQRENNFEGEPNPHETCQYFVYEHLPKDLRLISRPFYALARDLDALLEDGSQKNLTLTHLLQAKDAAVRARLTDLNKKD